MSTQGPEFVGDRGIHWRSLLPPLPGKAKLLLFLLLMVLIPLGGFYVTFLEYVRPYEFGIMETKIAIGKSHRGIQKEIYPPGLAFVMPFGFQRMHHFPRTVQVLELASDKASSVLASDSAVHDSAAKIQTSDGFSVEVDVTILYRIEDPYRVITTLGPGNLYLQQGVRPKAEPILKETLGELTTEEFFDSPLRTSKANMARERLNGEMEPKGIKIEQVLVRYFRYSERIQESIEAKKLQDQLVFTNHSKKRAAMQQQNLNRVSAKGEMDVQVTLEQGRAYGVQKQAEADLYTRKKKAEADLLVKLAEAKRTELRNTAMQLQGSDRMVAMKMADVLEGLDTIMVPAGGAQSLNPLNLETMLSAFGVNLNATASATPPPAALGLPPLPESAEMLGKLQVAPPAAEVGPPELTPVPVEELSEGEAAAPAPDTTTPAAVEGQTEVKQ